MTTVAIVDVWPVFALGLAQALQSAGARGVVLDAEALNPGATEAVDAVLLAPEAIPGRLLRDTVSRATALAPVLLLVQEQEDAAERYYGWSGAEGFLHRGAPVEQLLATVFAISGTGRARRTGPRGARQQPTESPVTLSQRERQVIWLISRGLTIQRIARTLAISPHTVDTYITRVRSKLGVGNKAELACAALDYPPAAPWESVSELQRAAAPPAA